MKQELKIAVVGAGIAGCASALMLSEQRHRVTLFERAPTVGPIGAGILLQPSGQNILYRMGLLDVVTQNAERIDELIAYTHRGSILSLLRYADYRDGMHAYGLHRGDLFSVLFDRILKSNIRLKLNTPIEEDLRKDYDLVIAGDGSRSAMRKYLGGTVFCHQYGPAALWLVGESFEVKHRLLQFTHHTKKLVGMLPMGGGRCSFFWGINSNEWSTLRKSYFNHWRDEVIQLMPLARSMLEQINSFDAFTFATYRAVYMHRVYQGNLVVVGDAAHAAGPHLGQGVNLALLDAWDLQACLAEYDSVPESLYRFNRRQRWRNIYYSLATAALMPSFQGNTPLIGMARDIVLPQLQQIAPIRYLMLKTLCGI